MIRHSAQNKLIRRDKSLTATGIVIAVIMFLLVTTYFRIDAVLRQRSLTRLAESANTAIAEITSAFERDSHILNATADIISQADNFNITSTMSIMKNVNPLLETMNISVLLPDDRILSYDGTISAPAEGDDISFSKEAPLGEHISSRTYDPATGKPILRHFVPIVQDGEIAALLYGITDLKSLPDALNVDNIFTSTSSTQGPAIFSSIPGMTASGTPRIFPPPNRPARPKGTRPGRNTRPILSI